MDCGVTVVSQRKRKQGDWGETLEMARAALVQWTASPSKWQPGGMVCMAGWEEQTEAMADREDLRDVIVTLLIALTQCLTECNLRDAVFMWVHGRGCSQSWCRRRGSGTTSWQPWREAACSHLSEPGRERDADAQVAFSFTLLDPSTWDGIAHHQGGSSSVFSQANPWLCLTDALGVS